MRVNLYSQELTDEVKIIEKKSDEDKRFSAIMFFLHSSSMLHQPPDHTGNDDDRSAVTFWLPKSPDRREALAKTFERMADLVRRARPEDCGDVVNLDAFDEMNADKNKIIEEICTIHPNSADRLILGMMGLVKPGAPPTIWCRDKLAVMHVGVLFSMLKTLRHGDSIGAFWDTWADKTQFNKCIWPEGLTEHINKHLGG